MKKQLQGFSLLEVMAAMSIMIIGMISIVTLMLQSIQTSNVVSDRTISVALAQEVFEVIRNERDSAYLRGEPFNYYDTSPDCTNLSNCVIGYPESCIVSSCDAFDVSTCNPVPQQAVIQGVSGAPVRYHTNIGYFQTDGFSCTASHGTKYLRKFEITRVSNNKINVCVHIYWNTAAGYGQLKYETCEDITNPQSS